MTWNHMKLSQTTDHSTLTGSSSPGLQVKVFLIIYYLFAFLFHLSYWNPFYGDQEACSFVEHMEKANQANLSWNASQHQNRMWRVIFLTDVMMMGLIREGHFKSFLSEVKEKKLRKKWQVQSQDSCQQRLVSNQNIYIFKAAQKFLCLLILPMGTDSLWPLYCLDRLTLKKNQRVKCLIETEMFC